VVDVPLAPPPIEVAAPQPAATPEQFQQRAKRQNNGLIGTLARRLGVRRLPNIGPLGVILGLAGLVGGTIALSLVIAVTLRTMVAGDVFNPFREDEVAFTPEATPNPTFLAPTLDTGQGPLWQGKDRVTILVMGIDARPDEAGYRTRTDTMILAMIDPATKRASMLSIPRDLYVEIPGKGLERVNSAYVYGGGPLAVQTIEYNLGIPIDYYVVVDFKVFITLVDEIDGIDLYVPKEINDPTYPDEYYGYDPFYMPAGMQHMDGETALKYARTRKGDNDYERARRQQAVIMAIREKILTFKMLPTLIEKAPTLSAALADSVRTDMTLEEMIALARVRSD
jgi:LCP family protein required for cell wall assembly